MSRLRTLLTGNLVWSFALYVENEPFAFDRKLGTPIKLFSSRRLKFSGNRPRDQADPFLIASGGNLYIFYEKLIPGGAGTIACSRTADLRSYEDLGVVLSEPHHLSYPFVFRDGADTFLLPEAKQSGEISLYRFDRFPFEPRKLRTLATGAYVDPFLVRKDGTWYLFATGTDGLEIFFAEDLRSGPFRPHPMNPVVTDARYSRNGGGPLRLGQSLVRVAQDCSESYGRNVSLMEIEELSPDAYREKVLVSDYFDCRESWNSLGGHHLSIEQFGGKTVIAADGQDRDFVANKLLSRLFR
jgi:hypothetical protein